MRLTVLIALFGAAAIIPAGAQSVLSVHSGVVHYVEGDAYIGNSVVESKFGQFPNIPEGQNFRTEAGRAEILLTPGSFLRIAENSEIRMVSAHLSDTRVELLKGEIAIESVDSSKDSAAAMTKGNLISIIYQGTTTSLLKPGLFQFTADPARVRVYEGEVTVKAGADEVLLKKGKEAGLNGALLATKFDPKAGDELIRWSSRRSGYLAMANVHAARTLSNDSSLWNSYLGNGYGMGGWAFNSLFGMYTFVPFGGIGYSPFGYSFWSPYSVYNSPFGYGYPYGYGGYYYGNGSGYSGGGGSSSGKGASSAYSRNPYRTGGIGGGVRTPVVTRPPGASGATAAARGGSGSGFGRSSGGGSFGTASSSTAPSSVSTSSRASSGGFGGGHASGGGSHK